MEAALREVAARRRAPPTHSPTPEGERQASRFRLAIGAVGVAIVAGVVAARDLEAVAGASLILVVVGWASVSAATLPLIHLGRYRPWLSWVSAAADVAFSAIVPFALMAAIDHNFTSGILAGVSFLVITLATVRRGPTLVIAVALAAALAHVLITAFLLAGDLPGGSRYLVAGGSVVTGINAIDQIAKALAMVIVGWVVAYVARGLRRSERHYQDLFEAIPDGVVIARADGAIDTVNGRFAEMVGLPAETLARRRLADLFATHPVPAGDVRPTAIAAAPVALRRADGARVPVRVASSPIALAAGPGAVLSVRDATDSAYLERELARTRKLDTIGRLAGGLAHDFNNILGGILGATSLAAIVARRVPAAQRERLLKQIESVEIGGRNARDVVKKLLDFTRTSPLETRPLHLAQVLADVAALCAKTLGAAIELTAGCTAEGDPLVDGDEGALKQALLNLCLNAGESLPGGGRIALRCEDAPSSRSFYARHPEAVPGRRYLCAVVEDDGPGLDPEALDDVFAPRFVAPSSSAGPDLGLSTVYRLAHQHGGFVDVSSSASEGTCVRLYLPRAAAAPAAPATPARPEAEELAS
jgi:PAS domain S-box-containing protein